MSNAINNMICDIGAYTEEIRVRTAEREREKSELNVASKIQLGIVPHNYSDFDKFGIDIYIYSYMLSVKIVGGHFYNFFLTKENKVTFFTVCLLHTFYSRFIYLSIIDVFNTLCKS